VPKRHGTVGKQRAEVEHQVPLSGWISQGACVSAGRWLHFRCTNEMHFDSAPPGSWATASQGASLMVWYKAYGIWYLGIWVSGMCPSSDGYGLTVQRPEQQLIVYSPWPAERWIDF